MAVLLKGGLGVRLSSETWLGRGQESRNQALVGHADPGDVVSGWGRPQMQAASWCASQHLVRYRLANKRRMRPSSPRLHQDTLTKQGSFRCDRRLREPG